MSDSNQLQKWYKDEKHIVSELKNSKKLLREALTMMPIKEIFQHHQSKQQTWYTVNWL